jgi:hypothetical protein
MTARVPDDAEPIRDRVRHVLLHEWDPHNAAARLPETAGAYDTYIDPLLELIRGGAGEDALADWLHEREQESMCFPPLGAQRLRRVARKLLLIAGPATSHRDRGT